MALYLGGPGAILWMWMVTLIGMATAYAASTRVQRYKTHNEAGQYHDGPAFYIARGLKQPWLAFVFSPTLILSFGLVFNAVQANAIAGAVESAFGIPDVAIGVVIAVLAGIVIFGGIRQIARVQRYWYRSWRSPSLLLGFTSWRRPSPRCWPCSP